MPLWDSADRFRGLSRGCRERVAGCWNGRTERVIAGQKVHARSVVRTADYAGGTSAPLHSRSRKSRQGRIRIPSAVRRGLKKQV